MNPVEQPEQNMSFRFCQKSYENTDDGKKAASGASQAARASSRILPHRPCRVVTELNSGQEEA